MQTRFPYLCEIKVNHVRHLGGFAIPIYDPAHTVEEPVHLMLTGRNGAGKTSLVKAAFECLLVLSQSALSVSTVKKNLASDEKLLTHVDPNKPVGTEETRHRIQRWHNLLDKLCGPLELRCYDADYLHSLLHSSKTP